MREHYDAREVKRRLPMLDLLAHEGVALRRSGPLWIGCCPFHEERSGSFTLYCYNDHAEDHAHCYGCGWNGDVIAFWREWRGVDFFTAIVALASLAAIPPQDRERIEAAQVPRMTDAPHRQKKKLPLPQLHALNKDEIAALAALRKLDPAAIAAAAAERRVGASMWPQFLDHHGAWAVAKDAAPCWVVTDKARAVAQFRKLDGSAFARRDGKPIKAWTKGSPTWPLGASEIGARGAVLLVEGGADMLAAYHFLHLFNRLHEVAVCAMLGASCSICDSALGFFARKRVRIFMDEDEPKPIPWHPEKPPIYPGREAAARWTAQLTEAGAAVETFSLAALTKRDGERVKDLNDLALVDEAAWLDDELREAFFDFDF